MILFSFGIQRIHALLVKLQNARNNPNIENPKETDETSCDAVCYYFKIQNWNELNQIDWLGQVDQSFRQQTSYQVFSTITAIWEMSISH